MGNIAQRIHTLTELATLEAEVTRRENYKIGQYFPDTGPLRRELYPNAMEFFRGGAIYPERLFLGGNRTGKTQDAAYEVTCHMTGIYPPWWRGRRFNHPVEVWAAGDTATTTRDIIQLELYGQVPTAPRTGFIPAHLIEFAPAKVSIPNAIEAIFVRHVSGGKSTLHFKSYDQRRLAFQGTAKHIIWLDEECPEDIYTECLMRTLTVKGIIMVTFTPVEGLTPFLNSWLETSVMFVDEAATTVKAKIVKPRRVVAPSEATVFAAVDDDDAIAEISDSTKAIPVEERHRLTIMVSWDEVPHLDKTAREQMLAGIPEYQRDARTRGIPNLGAGVIYRVPEDEIKVKPFDIPAHWPRGYGMDVGWNWTVALHGAYDRDTGIIYFYREHFRSHAEPPVHAEGIRAAGGWIPGRIDPAANGRSQVDGTQLFDLYSKLGLILDIAPNGVESGIDQVWTGLTTGKIKVFSNLKHVFLEYRMYRRDAKGRVVKKNDHLMDAMRYYVASGYDWLRSAPGPSRDRVRGRGGSEHGWMG